MLETDNGIQGSASGKCAPTSAPTEVPTAVPTTIEQACVSRWTYSNPESWCDACITGRRQSPVNILKSQYLRNRTVLLTKVPIEAQFLSNRFLISSWSDNDQLIRFKVESSSLGTEGLALVMDYNGVATIYILSHIVFHVGSAGGSEHLFDGRRLPMEIQLFCRRQVYESFESALPYPGGTLAVSVLLELATGSDLTPTNELFFAKIASTSLKKESMTLAGLFPTDIFTHYFTYDGSLTYPICNEFVRWVVASKTVKISRNQLTLIQSRFGGNRFRPVPAAANQVNIGLILHSSLEVGTSELTGAPSSKSSESPTRMSITASPQVLVPNNASSSAASTLTIMDTTAAVCCSLLLLGLAR